MERNSVIKVRLLVWGAVFLAILWIAWMWMVPGGDITYINDLQGSDDFISDPGPESRVKEREGGVMRMTGDPAYFNLRVPRRFEKAVLDITYRRSTSTENTSVIEAGVLADRKLWRYDLKPLENKVLNELFKEWYLVMDEGAVLLSRNKEVDSIKEFLDKGPNISRLAVYNYDLDEDFTIPGHTESGERRIIDVPIRGSYQLLTYTSNGDLDFQFEFTDLNRNDQVDDIEVFLLYKGGIINSVSKGDERGDEGSGNPDDAGGLNMRADNLPEGAYKIEVKTGDDIITEKMETKAGKLAFANRIWVSNRAKNGVPLVSDSDKISARTTDPASLQSIKAGSGTLDMSSTYKKFDLSPKADEHIYDIILKKGGVILEGDGVFSFSRDAFFNPAVTQVDGDIDLEGIDYILARYTPPVKSGGWITARSEFDFSRAYSEDNKYSFLISSPGLRSDDGIDDYIDIKRIKMTLYGETIVKKIKDAVNGYR